jgi:hypothetical protein
MVTYAEADTQYEIARQQYLSGSLDDNQYEEELHRLMVLDEAGLWWAKSRETGSWHFYDPGKGQWIAGTPPAIMPTVSLPPSSSALPIAPPSAGSAAGVSPILPGTSQGVPTTAGYSPPGLGAASELSGGTKVLFYALSLLVPILGLILYFVYRSKPALPDRSAARVFLILGIVSIVFSTMCGATFFLLEATMLGTGR